MVKTLTDEERELGITESISDFSGKGYIDGRPHSDYYLREEPDYEESHRQADDDMKWFRENILGE